MRIIINIDTTSIQDINNITKNVDGENIDYQDINNLKYLYEMLVDNEFDKDIFIDEIIEDFTRTTGNNDYGITLSVYLSRLYDHFIDHLNAHINNFSIYQYKVIDIRNTAVLLEYNK